MTPTLTVLRPGLLTTVQDLGRWGGQHLGIPVAGPMDEYAHRLANRLAGNTDTAATLEMTLAGPVLRLDGAVNISVAGAEVELFLDDRALAPDARVPLQSGALLRVGACRRGARAYLAVTGGFDTPGVLGSRATHLLSRMGGLEGRALRAGDVLPIAARRSDSSVGRVDLHGLPSSLAFVCSDVLPSNVAPLRVLAGPHPEAFDAEALEALVRAEWRVSAKSDRTGYTLEGAQLPRARGSEPLSEPVAFGAIQVPPSGEPILLMADRQTAGGYPKIATVITADLPLAGQLGPGDRVRFVFCTRDDGGRALMARDRQLSEQQARYRSELAP